MDLYIHNWSMIVVEIVVANTSKSKQIIFPILYHPKMNDK